MATCAQVRCFAPERVPQHEAQFMRISTRTTLIPTIAAALTAAILVVFAAWRREFQGDA